MVFSMSRNDRRTCPSGLGMRDRVRIQPYVPRDVAARLRAYASAKGASESSVVHGALVDYLDRDSTDRDLLMRRLDRNTIAIAEVRRDVAVVAEGFAMFVRAWFRNTIPLAQDAVEAGNRRARRSWEQLVQHVASSQSSGDGFIAQVITAVRTDGSSDRPDEDR